MSDTQEIEELARLQKWFREADEALKREEARLAFMLASFRHERETAEDAFRALELDIRRRAEEAWRSDGDKTPFPGVTVRETKRLRYEESDALKWARENGRFLKLDKVAFEKECAKLNFVDEVIVPVVAVESNLHSAILKQQQRHEEAVAQLEKATFAGRGPVGGG